MAAGRSRHASERGKDDVDDTLGDVFDLLRNADTDRPLVNGRQLIVAGR